MNNSVLYAALEDRQSNFSKQSVCSSMLQRHQGSVILTLWPELSFFLQKGIYLGIHSQTSQQLGG